jgi:hypothetical protein
MKYLSSDSVCLKMAAELRAAKSIPETRVNMVQPMCTVGSTATVCSYLDAVVYSSAICCQIHQTDAGLCCEDCLGSFALHSVYQQMKNGLKQRSVIYLFISTVNGFLRGGSGTTIRALKFNRCFWRTYRNPCLSPAFTLVSCLDYWTLKMEAICFSETSIDFQRITRCYMPENSALLTNAVRASNPAMYSVDFTKCPCTHAYMYRYARIQGTCIHYILVLTVSPGV